MKPAPLSTSRRILFTALMLLLPVLLLTLAELALRLFGYGESYPLVHKRIIFGKEKYVVNREIGQRYFFLPEAKTPEASEEVFDLVKKPNTVRIFCLGESTTAGFPYEINATFPFQLQHRLREALTESGAEVINLGIAAVNSHTVRDLLPEVLELQPDVLIIYMGHNEFYGAHGVGSSQYVSSSRCWIATYLKLRRLRLTRLLEQAISGVGRKPGADKASPRSMMEAMARDQAIPLDSEKFQIACRNFEGNLKDIIESAKNRNVQVLVSNLVSNSKDQSPFVSGYSPATDEFTRRRCESLLLEGRGLLESGQFEAARESFTGILELDSAAAEAHYYLAKSILSAGDSARAHTYFAKARDLDRLRFRAPAAFNRIIEKAAKETDVPLVDMEAVFETASPGGIPGKELFWEHLHPNFDGYRLMAQAFLEALRTLQVINPPEPIGYRDKLFQPENLQRIIREFPRDSAGVTELDLEFGAYRNFFLVNRWPFPERPVDLASYQPVGSEITKSLAVKHFRENTYWDEAHYELAQHYSDQGQPYRALREYRAVHLAFPENYIPPMKMGDVMIGLQQYPVAKRWYDKALELDPQNPFLLAKMGNLYVFVRQFKEAVEYFTETLKADSTRPVFSAYEKANLLYLAGVSHANLKNWPEARRLLDEALRLQPGFEPAEKLKLDIQSYLANTKE